MICSFDLGEEFAAFGGVVSTSHKSMRPMYIILKSYKILTFRTERVKPVLRHCDLPNVEYNSTYLVSARPPNRALADPSLCEPQHAKVEPYSDRFSDGTISGFFCFLRLYSIIASQTRLGLVS